MSIVAFLQGPWTLRALVLVNVLVSFSGQLAFAADEPDASNTARPADAVQATTLPSSSAPFGRLTTEPIVISPPLEHIPRNWHPLEEPRWYVPVAGIDGLEAYLRGAGLDNGDVRAVLATAADDEAAGMVVRPPIDLVRRLEPDVRARLYVPLMNDSRNRAQAEAYRYAGTSSKEWLGAARISSETRRLVEPLVYRHGDFLYFADIDLIRGQLGDEELQLLVKALLRHATVLAGLAGPDPAEVAAIVEYWGRGGRRTDIRPIIESIAGTDRTIDISHLLPTLARQNLYRYPRVSLADLDKPVLANCFWTALNFFNTVPDDRLLDVDYALERLRTDYVVVHNDLQLGDIVAFLDEKYEVFHVAVYLADGLVFGKNGFSSLAPWSILPIEHMKGHYVQHSANWRLSFHRRKDL